MTGPATTASMVASLRLRAGTVALALMLTIALAAIGTFPTAASAAKKGGTLTVGLETRVYGFDTVFAGPVNQEASMMVLESLFFQNPETEKIEPLLGLSMKEAADRKSWTIKLRRGIKFHDGTPFNAEAVAFTYNRILDKKNRARYRGFISTITNVEVKDEFTVVFHLKHPWGAFASAVIGPTSVSYIHSPTAVKTQGKDNNRNPVGTGPFLFKEWKSGDRVIVVRNPDYWGKQPYLDRVVFRLLPDPESRYASLLTKDVDVIWTDRPTHILKARKRKDLVVLENGGAGALTTFLNHAKPPLDDPRVRKALQLAFDNAAFTLAARKGVNPPAFHFLGPRFKDYCPDFKHPGPDLERARQLIKEYGKPVKVIYTHTTTIRGRNGALISQQMWNKIGVETVMDPVDQATLVRKVVTGNFVISGWRMVDEIDEFQDVQVVGTFYSKSPANYEHYKNPVMDKLVLAGRMEADVKKREKIYCKIAKLVTEDVPILFRGGMISRIILLPDVKGVGLNSAGRLVTKNAWLDR